MDTKSKEQMKSYKFKKDEEYMSNPQLEYFKTILLAWKQDIEGHNNEAKELLHDDSNVLPDANDRASLEEEFSMTLKSRDRERKLVRKIEKSLDRISNDDFGFCDKCDEEIGFNRLEARPTAEMCIDCKEIEEKREIIRH